MIATSERIDKTKMKTACKLRYYLTVCLACCAMCAAHAQDDADEVDVGSAVPTDSLGEVYSGPILTSKIHLTVRTYGDRISLRWLPEDYVSWMFLVQGGVSVLRVDKGTGEEVTLAHGLKPLSQTAFEAKYGMADSLAMVCAGVLYGEGRIGENQTQEPPHTMGANMEYNAEQDIAFAYAMLVAEWRPDLAHDMAVALTDRNVKPGGAYEYYVQPTVWDNGGKIIFEPGVRENVVNRPYEPAPYDPQVEDTLTSMCRFVLSWEDKVHSSFEIERRERGSGEWERLNKRPYVSMVEQTDYEGLVVFSDSVPYVGAWEYRVMAHDAFGELTPPSPVHIAYARDIQPPLAPQLKYIVLERPDDSDPMSRILAHVVWENPDAEKQDGDVQGYVIKYYNEVITGRQWQPITQLLADKMTPATTLISPTDTTAVVDVTGLRTGMMAISAYDNSGNENMGLAQMVRITDFKAPAPPDSLTATVLPSGNVLLRWQRHPADNDIAYFDLAFANDSTHEFLLRDQGGIQQEGFIDTLAMNVNQKYIYYKVRAIDWSNNIGLWSKAVQVKRPHNTPPSAPHLDESWHNDQKGMHMRWVVGTDADMDYHLLLRRLGGEGEWEVLARWDADSIAATGNYAIVVDDNPPYHQEERYFYKVESHNSTPYTAQSLAVSWLHQGPRVLDIPIRLSGAWVEHDGVARLAWDVEMPATLASQDYYYCIFRKAKADKRFRYQMNVAKDELEYADRQLKKGEEAEYRVSIRFKDGRESQDSNTVLIKRLK